MRNVFVYFKAYTINNLENVIWILLFAMFIFFIVSGIMRKQKTRMISNTIYDNVCVALLSIDCSAILVLTLLNREFTSGNTFEFSLFKSYVRVFKENDPELLLQIIMNIVIFIPMGFLLPCCFYVFERYSYILLATFILSLSIELIQGICHIGFFELNDILNNIIGTILGVMLHAIFLKNQNHNS